MQKRGFVRTLEAIIAVVMILGFILYFSPKQEKEQKTPHVVEESFNFILTEIAHNESFRNCIKNTGNSEGSCSDLVTSYGCMASINNFVIANTPYSYTSKCEVCKTALTCSGILPIDKTVYSDSFLLANKPNNKVTRVFMWQS